MWASYSICRRSARPNLACTARIASRDRTEEPGHHWWLRGKLSVQQFARGPVPDHLSCRSGTVSHSWKRSAGCSDSVAIVFRNRHDGHTDMRKRQLPRTTRVGDHGASARRGIGSPRVFVCLRDQGVRNSANVRVTRSARDHAKPARMPERGEATSTKGTDSGSTGRCHDGPMVGGEPGFPYSAYNSSYTHFFDQAPRSEHGTVLTRCGSWNDRVANTLALHGDPPSPTLRRGHGSTSGGTWR